MTTGRLNIKSNTDWPVRSHDPATDQIIGVRNGTDPIKINGNTLVPADGAVTTDKLDDGAVTFAKIGSGSGAATGALAAVVGYDPEGVPLTQTVGNDEIPQSIATIDNVNNLVYLNSQAGGYCPPNVSVATRTIQSALREFSFAQDRGAFGTDPIANTERLQAVFADYPYGTRVILPRGTTPFAPFTVPDFVKLEGHGSGTTALIFSNADGDSIVLGTDVSVTGVVVNYSVTKTSGRTFYWTGNGTGLEDVQVYNYFIAVENGDRTQPGFTVDPYMRRCRLNDGVVASGTAGAIFGNFSNGVVTDLVISGTSSGLQQDAGLVLRRGDTCYLDKVNATRVGAALVINPAGPYSCLAVDAVECHFDSSGQIYGGAYKSSAELVATGGGQVKDIIFTSSWFGLSAGGNGLLAGASGAGSLVDGVQFAACQFVENANDGAAFVGAQVKNWSIGGASHVYANGRYGLLAAGGTTDFTITGNRVGPIAGRGPNNYGIVTEAGSACDRYVITSNNCLGNTTSNLFDGATGTNKIVTSNLV